MTSNVVRILAPNGDEYHVDVATADTPKTIKQQLISGGSMARWFSIAEKGYHELTRKHLVSGARDNGKVTVHGRDCLIMSGSDGSVATFIGQYHELQTAFGGPAPTPATVTKVFSGLSITDSPQGMVVRPKAALLQNITSYGIIIRVPKRGHIVIPAPDRARALIPAHVGARTNSGELWRRRLDMPSPPPGVRGYRFVVGSSSGAGEVLINPYTRATDDELMAWLEGIRISAPGY